MLTLLSSARGQVAGALFAILGLLTAGLAGAESYSPPSYSPPSYFPPKKTPPKKVVRHHYKPVGQEKDVGTRVFYVPVPRYETKYVEKPVVVEKPVIVE